MVKKLEVTIREIKDDEVPLKVSQGTNSGCFGKYKKENGERLPSRIKPLILINVSKNIIALAKVREFFSEGIDSKKEVEYFVEEVIRDSKNPAYAISTLIDYYLDYLDGSNKK